MWKVYLRYCSQLKMLGVGPIMSALKIKEIVFLFYLIPIISRFWIFLVLAISCQMRKISGGVDFLSWAGTSTEAKNLFWEVLIKKLPNLSRKVFMSLQRYQIRIRSLSRGKWKDRRFFKDRNGGKSDQRHIKAWDHIQQGSNWAGARKLNKSPEGEQCSSIVRRKR